MTTDSIVTFLPAGLTTDGVELYWLQGDGAHAVWHMPKSGIVYRTPLAGGPEVAIVGPGCRAPWFLAVDADYVQFSDDGNNGPNGPGSIVRVAKQ